MPNQVKIMAVLTARPGKAGELEALLTGMAPACRAEPGNLRWDIWQVQSEPGRFVLDELYAGNAAVADHRDTPHYQEYLARIGDLAERMPLVLDPIQIG